MAENDRVETVGLKAHGRPPTDFAAWSDEKLNRRLASLLGRGRGWQAYVRCSKCQHKERNARAGQPCRNPRPGQDACPGTYQREPRDFVRELDRFPAIARQLNMAISVTIYPNGEADVWVADIEHGVMRRHDHIPEDEIGHRVAAMLVDAADLSRKIRGSGNTKAAASNAEPENAAGTGA